MLHPGPAAFSMSRMCGHPWCALRPSSRTGTTWQQAVQPPHERSGISSHHPKSAGGADQLGPRRDGRPTLRLRTALAAAADPVGNIKGVVTRLATTSESWGTVG